MTDVPRIAEYFWSGGRDTHTDLRSKCKTVRIPLNAPVEDYPEWNFDGSSTGQNIGKDTEVLLKPVRVFPHPFIKDATLVLCETYHVDGTPTVCNTRSFANYIFTKYADTAPIFGLEQEYVINEHGRPYRWPTDGFPAPQGPYYCGNGHTFALGRDISLEHYQACLFAGLKISGTNAEVMPSQWEFQVGPCLGIEEGDHLVTARFLFKRIGEKHGIDIDYTPKPLTIGDWNGTGCHTNFSTKIMREEGGYAEIQKAVKHLGEHRAEDMRYYGEGNELRLTGKHETASIHTFSDGVGTRDTSIRIPNMTKKYNKGYFEDRRPAANIDPYLVTARVFLSSLNLPELAIMPPPDSWKLRGEQKAEWVSKATDFTPIPCMVEASEVKEK
eukprot:TRINITY_DN12584_c0_g1_i1.p1 TRINITY_DN12584_c0_g1~~TRINITY_DN12584_c0_g1_i1.p1  ORF type:complete len:385 (+),score=60.97 TRINITY_DN12584_c0_g1_i1:102-1256(+)